MFGTHFYHQSIRKAVAVFGSLFNDINIVRQNTSGNIINQVKVPLSYAPRRDFLARLDAMQNGEDAERQIAVKLPRMSFEILAMDYESQRQLPKTNSCVAYPINYDGTGSRLYTPVPYTITFQLNVYAKSQDDALQIVEQILPYFTPTYTVTVKPLNDFEKLEDTPISLTGVTFSDDYEAPLEARRTIIYTLDFNMKISLYKSVSTGSSIIESACVNFLDLEGDELFSTVCTEDPFTTYSTSGITSEDTSLSVSFKVVNLPSEPTTLTVSTPTHGTATATIDTVTTNVSGRIDMTGTWTYQPALDYNGSDTFTITVEGKAIPISVTVQPVSDAVDDSAEQDSTVTPYIDIDVGANDTFEATTLVYSIAASGDPSNGTVSVIDAANGIIRYTPTPEWEGTDTFVYRVTPDGGTSETATVTVVVTASTIFVLESGDTLVLEDGTNLSLEG